LVDGLLRVQTWYRARLRNSFNLAVYFSSPITRRAADLPHPGPQQRAPFARSDRSFYEVVLGEQVTTSGPSNGPPNSSPSLRVHKKPAGTDFYPS
jgi:hypothetical protein